jgi:hypothetical protein
MLCPHCGKENAAGRKFCRFCAKPLTDDVVSPPQPSAQPASSQPTALQPVANPMAIASLVFSFLAFILPFGIASVVMGHISRKQIAKSRGRQSGTGLAFAGLIISYLQLIVLGLIGIGVVAEWYALNRELDRHPGDRALLIAGLKYGNSSHPSGAEIEQHRQSAVNALRLIAARQTDYLAAHPDEGYACQLYLLQFDPSGQSELNDQMANSRYEIRIGSCRTDSESQYAVVAVPRSQFNPPDSPIYCLNQSGVIRKYWGEKGNEVIGILFQNGTCPESGEMVE